MKNPKSMWLLAAVVTAGVGVAEAATVLHLISDVTVVDTGALLFTGFLAGILLGFYVAPAGQVSRPTWALVVVHNAVINYFRERNHDAVFARPSGGVRKIDGLGRAFAVADGL